MLFFFRLCGVPFEVQGPYLSLEVPGLAEKRPSLALGDTAIATLSNVSETQKFEGCIHEVRSRSILLMFDPKFHDLYCGEVYDVEFHFSRGQFRHGFLYILEKSAIFCDSYLPFVKIICPSAELSSRLKSWLSFFLLQDRKKVNHRPRV